MPDYELAPGAELDFYVREHNTQLPHSAFKGQTPDEMYRGTGKHVPEELAERRKTARAERLAANRSVSCGVCEVVANADNKITLVETYGPLDATADASDPNVWNLSGLQYQGWDFNFFRVRQGTSSRPPRQAWLAPVWFE